MLSPTAGSVSSFSRKAWARSSRPTCAQIIWVVRNFAQVGDLIECKRWTKGVRKVVSHSNCSGQPVAGPAQWNRAGLNRPDLMALKLVQSADKRLGLFKLKMLQHASGPFPSARGRM